ncbi:thioredoxin domain-containing protein [Agromyces soli]
MAERLRDAVSPYLRAHADNPVDWYPWGAEAFAVARERDVPVLVSIGYATCHWCHVMARESFSDPAIAELLARDFVAIKVDREEHPDVDSSYLAAASAFTRGLGWPLTVFTTPAGRAFYAGTYFPPSATGGSPSFREVLEAVTEAWHERRATLMATGDAVAAALDASAAADTSGALPGLAALRGAAAELAESEDRRYGGFGGAPKFPVAPVLGFLSVGDASARALARWTLGTMARSPLFDDIDGGFFRYATRADWSEPHYERMLSDNALLLSVAVELAVGAGGEASESMDGLAGRIARFLGSVLLLPGGGFASAQDSESVIDGRRNEGGYFRADASQRVALAAPALDDKVLTGWNGLAIGALARYSARTRDRRAAAAALAGARGAAQLLLAAHLDAEGTLRRVSRAGVASRAVATLEDVGMAAAGLVELALACGEVSYAVRARELIDRAMSDARAVAADARTGGPAADAGADPGPAPDPGADAAPSAERRPIAEADAEAGRIAEAAGVVDAPFAQPAQDEVLAALGLALPADPAEGAAPSGTTSCARAAWVLAALGAGRRYRRAAERAMEHVAGIALERPIAFGGALELMTRLAGDEVQLVVVLPDDAADERRTADDPDAADAPDSAAEQDRASARPDSLRTDAEGAPLEERALVEEARRQEASVFAVVTERQARAFADAGFELFAGRTALGGRATAYRCERFVCALPVHDAVALAELGAAYD